MNLSAGRRTWEEAASPAAVLLARKYEQAWRDSDPAGKRPNLHRLSWASWAPRPTDPAPGWRCLRADMTLRWETGEKVGAQWYLDRYADLGEDTDRRARLRRVLPARGRRRAPGSRRVPEPVTRRLPGPLSRVLQIHDLVGSGTPVTMSPNSIADGATSGEAIFPEAGQTIGGFSLVEELGRGAFARVFLAQGAPARRSPGRPQGDPPRLARAADAGPAAAHPYRAGLLAPDRRGDGPPSVVHALFRTRHSGADPGGPRGSGCLIRRGSGPRSRPPRAGRAAARTLVRPAARLSRNARIRGPSPGGVPGWPRPWTTPTTAAFCIATSSRPTCW